MDKALVRPRSSQHASLHCGAPRKFAHLTAVGETALVVELNEGEVVVSY